MPARKSVAAAAAVDSSDEDEINVNKVVETKTELDKVSTDCLPACLPACLGAADRIPDRIMSPSLT